MYTLIWLVEVFDFYEVGEEVIEIASKLNNINVFFLHLVELLVSTALKDLSYIWTIYFTLASTFKPIGSLSSTDENMIKHKLQRFQMVKVIPLKPHLIKKKFQLPPHTSHLFTLTFFPAENWYMDVKTTANPQLTSWLWRWRNVGILEEKISIPPHTSVPPGLRLPGFHLPSSSPCHQEVAGRGYLLPRSQWYDKWSAACEQSQSTKKYPIVVCCQPDEKLKNIGLTCPGTWGLPGNLSSEKKLMRLAPPSL